MTISDSKLYQMELLPMLQDVDTYLDQLFDSYGFWESEKISKKDFKAQLLADFQSSFL